MKKILLFSPVFLFSFYYPLEIRFQFMHDCIQNSSLPNKYEYCECIYNKLTNRFTYQYFVWDSSSPKIIAFIKKASKECLKNY